MIERARSASSRERSQRELFVRAGVYSHTGNGNKRTTLRKSIAVYTVHEFNGANGLKRKATFGEPNSALYTALTVWYIGWIATTFVDAYWCGWGRGGGGWDSDIILTGVRIVPFRGQKFQIGATYGAQILNEPNIYDRIWHMLFKNWCLSGVKACLPCRGDDHGNMVYKWISSIKEH